jgi:hypothetical protein
MSLEMDDLPLIESAGRLGRRATADSAVADAYPVYRPESGTRLSSAVLSLGLDAVSLLQNKMFPSGQQLSELQKLLHGGGSYTMYLDCGPYDYNATCNEACFGFAAHLMDPFYCATCAEQAADPTNNPDYNWHFVGTRGSIQYMDREPDVCAGRDAWKWKFEGSCGECNQSAVFRCHDGWKRYSDGTLDPTICQGIVSCDNKLTLC